MAEALAISLHAIGAETESGQGTAVDIGTLRSLAVLRVRATAAVGAPQLIVETSIDGTNWLAEPWTIQVVAALDQDVWIWPVRRYVRARWVIASGESITFDLAGAVHVLYAEPSDIAQFSLPEVAIAKIPIEDRAKACLEATAQAEGYVGGAYTLPLTRWGLDLRSNTARLAGATLLGHRGRVPQGADEAVFLARDNAMSWLKRLADGRLSPPDMIDSTPEVFEGGSVVASQPRRGW